MNSNDNLLRHGHDGDKIASVADRVIVISSLHWSGEMFPRWSGEDWSTHYTRIKAMKNWSQCANHAEDIQPAKKMGVLLCWPKRMSTTRGVHPTRSSRFHTTWHETAITVPVFRSRTFWARIPLCLTAWRADAQHLVQPLGTARIVKVNAKSRAGCGGLRSIGEQTNERARESTRGCIKKPLSLSALGSLCNLMWN